MAEGAAGAVGGRDRHMWLFMGSSSSHLAGLAPLTYSLSLSLFLSLAHSCSLFSPTLTSTLVGCGVLPAVLGAMPGREAVEDLHLPTLETVETPGEGAGSGATDTGRDGVPEGGATGFEEAGAELPAKGKGKVVDNKVSVIEAWAGMEGRCHSIAPPPQLHPWGRGIGRSLLPTRPPKSRTPRPLAVGF